MEERRTRHRLRAWMQERFRWSANEWVHALIVVVLLFSLAWIARQEYATKADLHAEMLVLREEVGQSLTAMRLQQIADHVDSLVIELGNAKPGSKRHERVTERLAMYQRKRDAILVGEQKIP